MRVILQTKNIDINQALEEFVQSKMDDLDSVIGSIEDETIEARVEISRPSMHHRKGDVYYAEVNLKLPGRLLRAVSENWDVHLAITEVKDELQRQIRKYKEKARDKSRRPKRV